LYLSSFLSSGWSIVFLDGVIFRLDFAVVLMLFLTLLAFAEFLLRP
jgi:hypothetical protein